MSRMRRMTVYAGFPAWIFLIRRVLAVDGYGSAAVPAPPQELAFRACARERASFSCARPIRPWWGTSTNNRLDMLARTPIKPESRTRSYGARSAFRCRA